jgi:hypothetical protein
MKFLNMSKYRFLLLLMLLSAAAVTAPACTKSGCPAQESLKPNVNRKGEIKSKSRGKSGLFPKKMTRKLKR